MTTPMTPAPGYDGPDAVPLAAPRAKIRPGRIWYLLPLAALLGGVAWIVFGVTSIGSEINSFARAPLPAGGVISLNHSGGYVVYYEGPGAQSGNIPNVRVGVLPASAGASVRSLAAYHGSLTYGVGSHEGKAVLTLQISHPGQFKIVTAGASSVPAGSDLAFGDSFAGGLVAGIVGGVLLLLAGLAGLIVLFVIRLVKTNRAKSVAAQQSGSAWAPPGSGWSPPGAQPLPGAQPPPGTQPPPSTQP